jgi:hypothetical protein
MDTEEHDSYKNMDKMKNRPTQIMHYQGVYEQEENPYRGRVTGKVDYEKPEESHHEALPNLGNEEEGIENPLVCVQCPHMDTSLCHAKY